MIALNNKRELALTFSDPQHKNSLDGARNTKKRRILGCNKNTCNAPPPAIKFICSELPRRIRNCDNKLSSLTCKQHLTGRHAQPTLSPLQVIISSLERKGFNATIRPTLSIVKSSGYFADPTAEEMASYGQDNDAIMAIRSGNVKRLGELLHDGRLLQCSNKFGESLLHMACRRGDVHVVKFLTNEAQVSIRVRDDYGRTPMHDACWRSEPNYELMQFLIQREPELLLLCDRRGHTPFEYVRCDHWEGWIAFLKANDDLLMVGDDLFAAKV